MIKVLANAMVGVIVQFINVSNQYVAQLKLTQCYIIISQPKNVLKLVEPLFTAGFSGFTMSLTITKLPTKDWEVDTPVRMLEKICETLAEK